MVKAMVIETKPFDEADYLRTDEDMAAYMTEALATRDIAIIRLALGAVARARGATGLSREMLQQALATDGNSDFATVLEIIDALGLRLTVAPTSKAA